MSWKVKNFLGRSNVKVRRGLWTSDPIPMNGEYKSDQKSWFGDGLDITVEGVSGFFFETIMNPTLVRTNVSADKNTVVTVNDGGVSKGKATVKIHITDDHGRNERSEVEVDMAK
ncbi:MAG: hypothetical protein V7641_5291 [Blastocatellia bacterium]